MKKNIFRDLVFFIISACLFYTHASAQQPGSVSQLLEQQKKEIEKDRDIDPAMKAKLLKMMNSKSIKDAEKWMDKHPDEIKAAAQRDEKMTTLPAPDLKRLAALPSRPLTKAQLGQYVQRLNIKLRAAVSAEGRNTADQVIRQAQGNSGHLDAASIAAWYNGAPQTGLLLSAKAVILSGNINAINNLGAMLNLSGYPEKAIPLLQYAVQVDSTNASLYNNLGTAWLQLGEKTKARQMFLSCVHYSPNNPEANNSLGCLYEAVGDTKDAVSCFENSLKGAYNQNADEHLSKLEPDYDLAKLIKFHYKAPKYFDQWHIEVPAECTEVLQRDSIEKIHDAFEEGLMALSDEYVAMRQQAEQELDKERKASENALMDAMDKKHPVKIAMAPFQLLAMKMEVKLAYDYQRSKDLVINDYKKNYDQLITGFNASRKMLDDQFNTAKSKLVFDGEGGRNDEAEFEQLRKKYCGDSKKLADKTQYEAAQLHIEFKKKYRRLALDYFNDRVYWAHQMSTFPATVNVEIYNAIDDFIGELKYMSATTPYIDGRLCALSFSDGKRLPPDAFDAKTKPDCPLSVNIAFLIGKINIDCTSFSISGGEGIKLGYKKDFSNGQSTLSVGAGVSAQVGVGNVNAGVSADQSIFITFNGDGQPCDVGMKTGVSAGVNAGTANAGDEVGYTVSMNSGFNFTHSGLSSSLNL
ncbi:MAG TPA: hypothetical protein VFL76_11060 [Edaphocola sp.]|nr:hypothetical protein [Edaphocola sp.]